MAKRKVLLVDDDLLILKLAGIHLARGGYEVVTAEDGREALKALQENPDVGMVVSDLEMPGLDGYGLSIEVRRSHPTLPIVVSTNADITDDLRAAARNSGVTELHEKVYDGKLVAVVNRLYGTGSPPGSS